MTNRAILIVRHCQATEQNPDAPLTETGQHQARFLSEFLAKYPIDFVVASQYRRARQSIEHYANKTKLPIHQDERFNERVLSAEPIENWQEIVRDSFEDKDLRAPGGESADEVLRRAWDGLIELIGAGHELPVVVTHGNLLALVLHSLDSTFGYQGWKSLTNPDVFVLREKEPGLFNFNRLWA